MRPPKLLIKLVGRAQTALLRATGGRVGSRVGAARVLLLTTTGRRSGKARVVPLLYVEDRDAFVIVGSQGGHDSHPAWYLNLRARPDATVEIGRQRIRVRADEAGDDDIDRLWPQLIATYPAWEDYRSRTARRFPVMLLHRR